jgi:hypothetical protein
MKTSDNCKILKNAMALESWTEVLKGCLLMLKLQNGTVNYSIILWSSKNCCQPKFTVHMKLGSFGSVEWYRSSNKNLLYVLRSV